MHTVAQALSSCAAAPRAREEYERALNPEQRFAVGRLLAARDYGCLLGMPGTGKTSTLAFLIRSRSVLITSHTHSAVDILLKCIEAGA